MSGTSLATLLRRSIRRGTVTMFRERGFLTTLGSLLGVVFVVQLLILSLAGIIVAQQIVSQSAALQVDIQPTATDNDIQQLFGAVRQLPSVSSVSYVTKDKAYESERAQNPELIDFIEKAQMQNPFHDSLSVSLRSPDDSSAFLSFAQNSQWSKIIDASSLSRANDHQTELRDMQRLILIGFVLVGGFSVFVLLVLLFVLIDLVRRRCLARKEEILVERLSGASLTAILLPFATEGTLLLLGAVCGSAALLAIAMYVLLSGHPSSFVLLSPNLRQHLLPLLSVHLPIVFAAEFLLSPILAFIATWIGMRPALRKNVLAG